MHLGSSCRFKLEESYAIVNVGILEAKLQVASFWFYKFSQNTLAAEIQWNKK